MKTMTRPMPLTRLILIVLLALPFAACKKEAPPKVEKAAMTAPATDDSDAWRAYLQDAVPRNMGSIVNQPYVYFLPGESTPDFQDQYDRLLEKASGDVSRGIVSGNLLAYASPASAKMADLVVAAFEGVPPEKMKGVKVLFFGAPADKDRVAAAVAPAGVDFVFIDTE